MEDLAAVGKNPQETPPTLALEAGAACGVSILSRVTCEANAGSHSLSFHGSVVLRLKLVDLWSPVLAVLFVAQAESQEDQRIGTTHDLDIASKAWVWLNLTPIIHPH